MFVSIIWDLGTIRVREVVRLCPTLEKEKRITSYIEVDGKSNTISRKVKFINFAEYFYNSFAKKNNPKSNEITWKSTREHQRYARVHSRGYRPLRVTVK
jgi:hypothetical protein